MSLVYFQGTGYWVEKDIEGNEIPGVVESIDGAFKLTDKDAKYFRYTETLPEKLDYLGNINIDSRFKVCEIEFLKPLTPMKISSHISLYNPRHKNEHIKKDVYVFFKGNGHWIEFKESTTQQKSQSKDYDTYGVFRLTYEDNQKYKFLC